MESEVIDAQAILLGPRATGMSAPRNTQEIDMNAILELTMDDLDRVSGGEISSTKVVNAHTDKGILSVQTKTDHETGIVYSTARWIPN